MNRQTFDIQKFDEYKKASDRAENCAEQLKELNQQIDDAILKTENWQIDPHIRKQVRRAIELRERLRSLTDRAIEAGNVVWES